MAAIFRHKHLNILKHNSTNKRIWYTRNTRIYKMKYKPQYGNISFFNYMHLMLSAKKFWYVRWKFRKVTKSEIICNSELHSCFMRELKAGISRFEKWLLSSYSLYIKGHRAVTNKWIYLRIWRYYSTFISVFALYCKTYLIQLPFLKKR